MKLNFESVVNPLSMGQVSVNLLREFYQRGLEVNFFPIGQNLDFGAYNKTSGEFQQWVVDNYNSRLKNYDANAPSLKLWHISGSESRVGGKDNYLYTFYETDEPTKEEINIVKSYKKVFFSSSHAAKCFIKAGCNNVKHIPLGFDPDFGPTNKEYHKDKIHFGLIGKFEDRKNTKMIIQSWLEKYGDNPNYLLTLLVNNSFFENDMFSKIMGDALFGKRWKNLNIIAPNLKNNEEVNELHNAIDIDLSGLSSAEGFGLPAFNSCCLGKIVCAAEVPGIEDWAHGPNVVKIKPIGKKSSHDGFFFKRGGPFNQGSFAQLDKQAIMDCMDKAVELHNKSNFGVRKEMMEAYSYKRMVDDIFSEIF